MSPERNDYRTARRAFIAACEAAHVDAIARLHPAKGPDGGLLFMDSASLGARLAEKALLVIANDAAGSRRLTRLLTARPPSGVRLVLVHACDPAAFAGVAGDPAWPAAMLQAVATEDLSRVRRLMVVDLTCGAPDPVLPRAVLKRETASADIAALLAAL